MGSPSAKPFCHCFEHESNWYVYDVNTNSLYKIDDVLAQVLPIWGEMSEEQVVSTLAANFTGNSVNRAIAELKEAQEESGMFLPCYPEEILSPAARYESPEKVTRSSVTLTVTEQCNLRCRYCPHSNETISRRRHSDETMSLETAFAAIDLYDSITTPDIKTTRVCFFGGEALLQFDLIKKTIAYCRTKERLANSLFAISTNGTLMDNDEIIDYLIENRIELQFSLDGPRDIHDRYRVNAAGKGSYDSAILGLEKLLAADPTMAGRIRFVATVGPPSDLLRVAEFYEDFPVFRKYGIERKPRVTLNHASLAEIDLPDLRQCADECSRNNHASLMYYIDACSGLTREQAMQHLLVSFDRELRHFHGRDRNPLKKVTATTGCCDLGSGERMHVKANGDVQICEKVCEGFTIGNVRTGLDQSRMDEWYGYMRDSIRERCRTCWALRLCRVCFVAMNDTVPLDNPSMKPALRPEFCESIRSCHEDILRLYLSIMERNPDGLEFLNESPRVEKKPNPA